MTPGAERSVVDIAWDVRVKMGFAENDRQVLAPIIEALLTERTARVSAEARLSLALKVVEAAKEWKRGKEWADQNPGKLIKSSMTSEEAGEVMTFYFDKERKLIEALASFDQTGGSA